MKFNYNRDERGIFLGFIEIEKYIIVKKTFLLSVGKTDLQEHGCLNK